jgi:hypothetical protein
VTDNQTTDAHGVVHSRAAPPKAAPREKEPPVAYARRRRARTSTLTGNAQCTRSPEVKSGLRNSIAGDTANPNRPPSLAAFTTIGNAVAGVDHRGVEPRPFDRSPVPGPHRDATHAAPFGGRVVEPRAELPERERWGAPGERRGPLSSGY